MYVLRARQCVAMFCVHGNAHGNLRSRVLRRSLAAAFRVWGSAFEGGRGVLLSSAFAELRMGVAMRFCV